MLREVRKLGKRDGDNLVARLKEDFHAGVIVAPVQGRDNLHTRYPTQQNSGESDEQYWSYATLKFEVNVK